MKMFQSLHLRYTLTLWYVGILAGILCGFGGLLYSSAAKSLLLDMDRTLALQADSVSKTIRAFWEAEQAATGSKPGNWEAAPSGSLEFAIDKGRFPDLVRRWAEQTNSLTEGRPIRLVDASGRPLAVSESFRQLELPIVPGTLAKALHGKTIFETFQLSNYRLRMITYPVIERRPTLYLVQVASSLSQSDIWLAQLRLWLLWLIPTALIVTVVVGWFLATIALRPVGRIITQAQQIRIGHLHERVDVPRTGDELQRLAVTFNDMLARFERDFRRMRQFSAAASHELRTPLTVMKGEMEVTLRKPRTPDEYEEVLNTQLQVINDMALTVEELLKLAHYDAVEGGLEWRPVELGELIQHVGETWRKPAASKDIRMDINIQSTAWVRGERLLLERMVANLLDNAIRHTPARGSVTVQLEKQDHHACLVVRDTGSGISEEEMPQIFDRFFKQRSETGDNHSTGLGLGLCRWILEAHDGRIDAQSILGQGASFTVVLPLIHSPS